MKKSKYITKYDYINYYTKQPQMWFFTNEEISNSYHLQYQNAKKNNYIDDNIDELDDNNNEDEEIDDYVIYRENLFNNQSNTNSIDDPQLISGQIIDQKSKEAIKNFFKKEYKNKNFFCHDFDDEKITLEDNFKKTLNLLSKHENTILFQPAFIDTKKKIATKCDAIVKINDKDGNWEIFLIETKGTSTAKIHHILDLFFQKKVIEEIFTNKTKFNYYLCLIKYEKLYKQQLSFIISKTINLSKTVAIPKFYDIKTKQKIKIGEEYLNKKSQIILSKNINEILNFDKEYFYKLNHSMPRSKYLEKFELLHNLLLDFNNVIDKLWQHKLKLEAIINCQPKQFKPNKNDKSSFKTTDLWNELRKLYLLNGYELFKYSGNVIDQTSEVLEQISNDDDLKNKPWKFIKTSKNHNVCDYKSLFFDSSFDIQINYEKFYSLMNKLKDKKVYFDFETINPAIRVVDKSLPFTQIVTQNSVIIDENNNEPLVCNNLMQDPLHYDDSFYKKVIDSIYRGNNYSYIVYNKTFEKNRLLEMAEHLNNDEYSLKVNVIIDNFFDLADFFKISQSSGFVLFYKELGGFYSIKKILPLIEKYDPNIFEITKCVNYDDLEIKNGQICQKNSLLRFFGFYKTYINEQKWAEIVENSKKYCENDVRAMVAIMYFLQKNYK